MADASTLEGPANRRTTVPAVWPWLALAILAAAGGVLLVSLSYAAGRDDHSWAGVVYWAGHLLMFAPLAAYVLSPKTPNKWVAVVALALFQALTKWMYSPVMFKFPDELQHLHTGLDIVRQQALFHANPALPVSPQFPGLEEITTSLMSITGLSQFAAGQVVAGLAHVALAVGIFVLMLRVTGDEWIAGVASLIFAISPHNGFFNGLWIYEAPALVFMVVALVAAMRRGSIAGLITAVICLAAVTVTHHVTAAVTALILLALGAGVLLQGGFGGRVRQLLVLGAVTTGLIAAWVIFVAPATYQYLAGPVGEVLSGFLRAGSVSGNDPVGGANVSPFTTAATAVGTGTMAVLVIAGVYIAWRECVDTLMRTFAILGLAFFGIIGIRFLASDGAELAGRLLTYEYLFVGVAAALALTRLWAYRKELAGVLGLGAVVLVFVGNTTSGWPAPYEFVPGKFKIDAFESGVDPAGVRAAQWVAANLPHDANVACDWTSCSLVGGYGSQAAYANVPDIFYSRTFDARTRAVLSNRTIDFVVIDRRVTKQRPVGHAYFDNETAAQTRMTPLPAAGLAKFDRDPRVDRVYEGGPVVVYDVRRLRGA